MCTIKNLTPHVIRLRLSGSEDPSPDSTDVEYPSWAIARVATRAKPVLNRDGVPMMLDGAPVLCTEYGVVEGLPEPEPGVLYAVSLLVMQALPHRHDLIGPATGPKDGVVRDGRGQVYAIRAWQSVCGTLPDPVEP